MVYVITGGPGFGKTSIINELDRKGFRICPEEARVLLEGTTAFPKDFERKIAEVRLNFLLSADPEEIAFSDRGLPDQIAYSWYKSKQPSPFIEEIVTLNRYAPIVFLTPPWKNIYSKDQIRKENFEEACVIHDYILQAYLKFGYQPVDLPFTSAENRVAFILNFLGI